MSTVSVRYIVFDVDEAIAFYTQHLGFHVEMHPAPGFARLTRDDLHLLLNAPSGSGGPPRLCRMVGARSLEAGIASKSRSTTSQVWLARYERAERIFATTS